MKHFLTTRYLITAILVIGFQSAMADEATDSLFTQIQRSVSEVDFDAMAAAYHPDAVLVTDNSTQSIASVMPKWRAAGEKFAAQGGKANVEFRFSSRHSNTITAFDIGIFCYSTVDVVGTKKRACRHFENLAIYKGQQWQTLMERQMHEASDAEWAALAPL